MSEKKAMAAIVERNPNLSICHAFYAGGFSLRRQTVDKMMEILFQPALGNLPPSCVVFDPLPLHENKASYEKYLGQLPGEPNDKSVSDIIPYTSQTAYANFLKCSFSQSRAETLFGLVTINDVANLRQKDSAREDFKILYQPTLLVYSTLGFQKKLISELLR